MLLREKNNNKKKPNPACREEEQERPQVGMGGVGCGMWDVRGGPALPMQRPEFFPNFSSLQGHPR